MSAFHQSPAGILAWVTSWSLDTTFPLMVLVALPLVVLGGRRNAGFQPPANSGFKGHAWQSFLIGLCSLAASLAVGLRSIEVPATAWDRSGAREVRLYQLPPAYHDEFSYLLQAQTFLSGHVASPAMTVAGDAFHQVHVLNRPVTASRYFPWTAAWMTPFVLMKSPIAGHWIAGALAAIFFHRSFLRIVSPQAALVSGLLVAVCPGLAIFSNLLLAHHPTLLALSIFLLSFLKLMDSISCHQTETNSDSLLQHSLISGSGLALAMLGRPMTAAGFALPFGLWLFVALLRSLSARKVSRSLRIIAGFLLPLSLAFGILGWLNRQITGSWTTSAYQYYTDTWTPRHRYGFGNGLESSPADNVLKKYDDWAANLTSARAVQNIRSRSLASGQWTLGLIPAMFFLLLSVPLMIGSPYAQKLRLILASIVSLHLVHIPYWFDGILHWHYVFESAPLILVLCGAGIETASQVLQHVLKRRTAGIWISLLSVSALIPAWIDAGPLWGHSLMTMAVSEQSFSRVRFEQFRRMMNSTGVRHPCLILVDEQAADPQLSYIVNLPENGTEVLVCRLPSSPEQLQELRSHFAERTLYRFDPASFTISSMNDRTE